MFVYVCIYNMHMYVYIYIYIYTHVCEGVHGDRADAEAREAGEEDKL